MKNVLERVLCKNPRFYEKILRLKNNYNIEKIVFLNLISNKDVVFDIGANQGYYTLLFSNLVGEAGQVHAFEPILSTFKQLSKQISEEKRFDNVYINNTAVGDADGNVALYMPDNDHGQASMTTHSSGSWTNAEIVTSYECKVIKLDNYASSNAITRLDFIKCDVEGAELLALKGFVQTIAKYLPIIHLEICHDWTKNFNFKPIDIVDFLSSLGYSNFYLVSDGIRPLNDPKTELSVENFSGSANLLCAVPKLHNYRVHHLTHFWNQH